MKVHHPTGDFYKGQRRKYVFEGEEFRLVFTNNIGFRKDEQIPALNGELRLPANETTGWPAGPFEDLGELSLVHEDVQVKIITDEGEIEYVEGEWDNTPAYSPFYGVTGDGEVYEIEIHPQPGTRNDDLLGMSSGSENTATVRNVQTGWARPIPREEVNNWFDSGTLQPLIPINR